MANIVFRLANSFSRINLRRHMYSELVRVYCCSLFHYKENLRQTILLILLRYTDSLKINSEMT